MAVPRRQEELRLVASRLAYYDIPTLRVLQSVSSGLIETWDPMVYLEGLDEDGFHSRCVAQASTTTPFFEVCHGGVPDIAGHSSSLDILHAVGGTARTVILTVRRGISGSTRSPTCLKQASRQW